MPHQVKNLDPPSTPILRCSLPDSPIANKTCPPEQTCVPPIFYDESSRITEIPTHVFDWGVCIGASCDPMGPPQPCPSGQTCLHFEDPDLHLPGKCVMTGLNDNGGEGGACRMNSTVLAGYEDKGGVEDCYGDVTEWSCVIDENAGCTEVEYTDQFTVAIDWETMCWGLCMPRKWENCFEEGRWPGCH